MKHSLPLAALLALALQAPFAHAQTGSVEGHAHQHTDASIAAGLANAKIALPASITGGETVYTDFDKRPATSGKVPVVIFLHGSSGLNPKLGFDQWQQWLAREGVASFFFDGMQLDDRLSYKSPVDKTVYEKIHALRASEIDIALNALKDSGFADMDKLFLAGTSEGAVAVARYDGDAFIGKLIYSWSCEDNYFVQTHQTSQKALPVLNIVSNADKYFSTANDYLGNSDASGHCLAALGETRHDVQIILIPNAPHTLINLPAARSATLGFLESVLDQNESNSALQ
ncbi:MAG: hypothetical protein Q4D61_01080 [Cardiobacteriaceae bacterium]|nr:hypothetical protein [Cardiobacteriaceae bacterium]